MAEETIWEVVLTRPAERVCDRLAADLRERLEECFLSLESNPLFGANIKALTGQLKGLYRHRLGEWRVICRVLRAKGVVEVIAILPRGNAY